MSKNLENLSVSDLLYTRNVKTCSPQQKISELIKVMADNNFGAIIITDENEKVIGIFTERDFLKLNAKSDSDHLSMPVEEFMTEKVTTVLETTPLSKAFGIMRMARFRHLVVVDEEKRCNGIISIKDAFDYTCDLISSP
jgi:CBS domain-containing protein